MVIRRFNPVHRVDRDYVISLSIPYHNPSRPLPLAEIKQAMELFCQPVLRLRGNTLTRTFNALDEALWIKWLENIINGVQVKGSDGVFVVSREKDDRRHPIGRNLLDGF